MQKDIRYLIKYWLDIASQAVGLTWIIFEKKSIFHSKITPCGFVTFVLHDSPTSARISYAIKPEFRRQGIATRATNIMVKAIKNEGIKFIEIDIDDDNIASQKTATKLGFVSYKKLVVYDPSFKGPTIIRHLWKKDLTLKPLNSAYVSTERIPINAPQNILITAYNNNMDLMRNYGNHPILVVRYYYLLGRLKFNERNYESAYEAFGQCNTFTMNNNLPDNHETYYWFARMKEIEGELDAAGMYYHYALQYYSEDSSLISKDELRAILN